MAQFVVLEPAGADGADRAVFVRDGFSVVALVLPVLWLLLQKLWLEAAAVLALSVALGFLGGLLGLSAAISPIVFLVGLFVALESPQWKIARLRRRGFAERAAVAARNRGEAEIRYFMNRAAPEAAAPSHPLPQWDKASARPLHASTGATIGFVGHRGEN